MEDSVEDSEVLKIQIIMNWHSKEECISIQDNLTKPKWQNFYSKQMHGWLWRKQGTRSDGERKISHEVRSNMLTVCSVSFTGEPRLKQPLGWATVSGHGRTSYFCELCCHGLSLAISCFDLRSFSCEGFIKTHPFLQKDAPLTNENFSY